VVDSSSPAVKRRHRRAKPDRLEGPTRRTRLLRYGAGAQRVWRMVRVPRAEEDDRRQLHLAPGCLSGHASAGGPSGMARTWERAAACPRRPLPGGPPPLRVAAPQPAMTTSAPWPLRWPGAGDAFRQRVRGRRGSRRALATVGAGSAGAEGSRWRASGAWPDGGVSKPASCRTARLSQPRGSTGCETGLGWAAREETGVAVRTAREQGRPPTALSRRHERMPDQVCGGKRPTRIDGGLRRMRRTPASARGTVAARRDERKSLTSAPTEKVSSSPEVVFPSASSPTTVCRGGGVSSPT
jgi:hypothetical protein